MTTSRIGAPMPTLQWRDRKRYLWLFGLVPPTAVLLAIGLVWAFGQLGWQRVSPVWWWIGPLLVFVLLPILQRHSDHHANPTRRYQTLRSMDGAPNLPSGYASMIGLAYLTPLWRKVMDHRVLAHYNGDITRVNIQPGKRNRVLAKYGAR
ncbi:hypothetical protein [Nocardia sp. NPDC050710]|uniref:hypothetical protein n=1 Tax=Nocardia sp. NPDC050710 TaxID=3157220 RepID=UPI0033FE70BE